MNYKDFMELSKPMIKNQKKHERNAGYVNKDDLSVLYRFICRVTYKTNVLNEGDSN